MDEIYEFIKKCGTYYLATVEDGQPRVRPFGTVNIFEGKLYIQTGRKKDVSKQIQKNPKVELCCFNGSEWCRVAGELVDDNRIEPKKAMLESYPELKKMYSAEDENTQVLYLKNATATLSSFAAPPKVMKL
ncbi:MAG: pyridoxamine 5'-phosphate oxidase family protein [Treponema sp.]|nr:pyridoxamine 5'-phosphate oxidase family protein [Treponema sp.]